MGSVKASINMQTVFGWWDWDAEAPGMVNRVTGERVVYRGRAREEVLLPDRETWLRFDYLHSELTFPLLVQEVPGREELGEDKTTWQLDYRRSAALWRRETGASEPHPSYGVWRRIDDCVSDALACWPESQMSIKPVAAFVHLDGGWLNGAWSERMTRSEERLVIPEKREPDDEDYNPWLFPLDAPSPSPFAFYDCKSTKRTEERRIEDNPVLLKGLEFSDARWLFEPKLSLDAPLAQLEGRTAYLLSRDEKRLLYPYWADTETRREPGHWGVSFRLLYVDEYILFSMQAVPMKQSSQGAMWRIFGTTRGLTLRSDKLSPAYFIRPRGNLFPLLSRPLWQQLRWAITDAWCAWDGTEARHAHWLKQLTLLRANGVDLQEGFRGGIWLHRAQMIIRR